MAYRYEKDTEAFNELVKRHERPLFSYLRRRLADAGLAEDVFQETFINIIRKADQFQDDKKFSSWMYTIATNLATDCQRKNKHHKKNASLDVRRSGVTEGDGTLKDLIIGTEPDGYHHLNEAEQRAWVNAQIEELSDSLREAISLVYFQGLKYREAADILDIPVGTVKSRLHAAILELREKWEIQFGLLKGAA